MQKPKSYCEVVETLPATNVHRIYHDTAYGFPIANDDELFERLVLEINQAGLSWNTILLKQKNFKKAYHDFNIKKVAKYGARDRARLLKDAGIIRNRLKVDAAIFNANVILQLQKDFGSFKSWLDKNAKEMARARNVGQKKNIVPLETGGQVGPSQALMGWTKLFKKTFHFTGGEIVNEFLLSTGYLKGSHITKCPVYKRVVKSSYF